MSCLEEGKIRFKSGDPYKWSLMLLDRIETLEKRIAYPMIKVSATHEEIASRMAKARAGRKPKVEIISEG